LFDNLEESCRLSASGVGKNANAQQLNYIGSLLRGRASPRIVFYSVNSQDRRA
jgi:hypothetical protein